MASTASCLVSPREVPDGKLYFISKENATLIAEDLTEAINTRVEKGPL